MALTVFHPYTIYNSLGRWLQKPLWFNRYNEIQAGLYNKNKTQTRYGLDYHGSGSPQATKLGL